jgi:hypothetical protein
VQESDAGIRKAGRLVLLRKRVEGRIFSARETIEGVVESCLSCPLSAPLLLDTLTALGPSHDVPMWTEP